MQKTMKRTLALFLAVALCLSGLPLTVFAAEALPDETLSSQAPPSEAPAESSIPDSGIEPDASSQPGAATGPDDSPEPDGTADPSPMPYATAEPSPSPEPTASPDDPYGTELAQVDARQVWPALQRAKARAAAGIGASGVLQMGYYCFTSDVGTLTTLGEYVSQMPAKTMLINGTNVAAYCLEHEKAVSINMMAKAYIHQEKFLSQCIQELHEVEYTQSGTDTKLFELYQSILFHHSPSSITRHSSTPNSTWREPPLSQATMIEPLSSTPMTVPLVPMSGACRSSMRSSSTRAPCGNYSRRLARISGVMALTMPPPLRRRR